MKKLKMKKRLISYPKNLDNLLVRISRLHGMSANTFITLVMASELGREAGKIARDDEDKQNKQRALQKK